MRFKSLRKVVATAVIATMAVGMTGNVSNAITAGIKGSITKKMISGTFQYTEQGHQLKIVLAYKKLNLSTGTKVNGEQKGVANGARTDVATTRKAETGYNYLYMSANGYVDGIKKASMPMIKA